MASGKLKRFLFILLGFLIGCLIALFMTAKSHEKTARGKSASAPVVVAGKAKIGGPFELINQDGQKVSNKDLNGKYRLVFFGYTFCPDVCPTELLKITRVLKDLGPSAKNFQPVFISVDPDRDTPAQMKSYLSNFYPGFIGLTGPVAELKKVQKSYKVYAKAIEKDKDKEHYLMDHSAYIYLMGRDGQFIDLFSFQQTDKDILKRLKQLLTS